MNSGILSVTRTSQAFDRAGAIIALLTCAILTGSGHSFGAEKSSAASSKHAPNNLAIVATASSSFTSGDTSVAALNDGCEPRNSQDGSHGSYGNWNHVGTEWVEYEWTQPISTNRIDLYWWDDHRGVRLPKACVLEYFNGKEFVPVADVHGLGTEGGKYNSTTFAEVTTTKLRLEIDSDAPYSTGVLEWKVYDSGNTPALPPVLNAGPDRVVVIPGAAHLSGLAKIAQQDPVPKFEWTRQSGPGEVIFAEPQSLGTTATFTSPGDYVLKLQSNIGELTSADTVSVHAIATQIGNHLKPIAATKWKIDSPLWSPRLNVLITNWIPHCIDYLEHPAKHPNVAEISKYLAAHGKSNDELKAMSPAQMYDAYVAATGDRSKVFGPGGIDNFIEAGKALAGQPAGHHQGPPWANAYVYNTVESMCLALLLDPQGDAEIARAQDAFRAKLEEWIPLIVAAQEPDGYIQTRFTLDRSKPRHWDPRLRGEHEGYVAGYLIEAAIAHYFATGGRDKHLYDAAKKVADCWCDHIGPAPKQPWFDGHEALELALVRLGHLVNQVEGKGEGDRYITLAKFLIDCRNGGSEYDQSHVPIVRQYEAVGHAVRAEYLYSGLADVARATRNIDYQSALQSIWSNLVDRKYYVIGGVGSGDTSEGFGRDYALKNAAYCESCANCGQVFFQWRMLLGYADARYADLYEDTLFNAVLSDYDLAGDNFTYTNSLDTSEQRYPWHDCPCCVGNFPRTLLALPTWMYARSADGLYVNLFAGSTVNVEDIAGTDVQMVQSTDYPRNGNVTITVNPKAAKDFTIFIRQPNRDVSALYTSTPKSGALKSLTVNGQPIEVKSVNGYVAITRKWSPGDKIELQIPMVVQRVKCDPKVAANIGRVALRYGPMIYNIESVDCDVDSILPADVPLTTQFAPDLLGGVTTIKGTFADGKPMTAIPNFARNNRGGRSIVWIKDQASPPNN